MRPRETLDQYAFTLPLEGRKTNCACTLSPSSATLSADFSQHGWKSCTGITLDQKEGEGVCSGSSLPDSITIDQYQGEPKPPSVIPGNLNASRKRVQSSDTE